MPATVTITNKGVAGNRRLHTGTMNLGSYATGGVPITPSTFGLWKLEDLNLPAGLLGGTPRSFAMDWTTGAYKIMAFAPGGTEVPAATDLSTMLVRFSARGIG